MALKSKKDGRQRQRHLAPVTTETIVRLITDDFPKAS
jgi:hypothetical protein